MTFTEALGAQPQWLIIWFYWLAFAIFLLPLSLLIWKQTRLAAVASVAGNIFNALTVPWIYDQLGYVKLLGLPHLVVWTPLAWYLYKLIGRETTPVWARRVMWVIFLTLLGSLAFDYVDVARYLLGERAAMPGTI